MTPATLRQFWSIVENTQPGIILSQDDSSLVEWLMAQMRQRQTLASDESVGFNEYIRSKTTLIRDLVATR